LSARWYKRCGADFIHGTMMLSLEEKGAYSLCLDLIYDRGGPIPDEARWLSGVCGVSIRKWNTIRDRLIELGKLTAENGMISNSRADLEIISAEFQARERAESGAKGGRKRAENADATHKNNDLAQAELKPIEKIREDKNREEEVEAAPPTRARSEPINEALDHWNTVSAEVGWPRVQKLSEARRTSLRARLKEETLDGWKAGIARARASPLLSLAPPWFGFDWFLKPTNFLKVIEGNYDRQHTANDRTDGLGRTARAALAAFPNSTLGRSAAGTTPGFG